MNVGGVTDPSPCININKPSQTYSAPSGLEDRSYSDCTLTSSIPQSAYHTVPLMSPQGTCWMDGAFGRRSIGRLEMPLESDGAESQVDAEAKQDLAIVRCSPVHLRGL